MQPDPFLLPRDIRLLWPLAFQGINKKSTNMVESWSGRKAKQPYTHPVFKNASFTFTWAFQRTNQGQDVSAEVRLVTSGWSGGAMRGLWFSSVGGRLWQDPDPSLLHECLSRALVKRVLRIRVLGTKQEVPFQRERLRLLNPPLSLPEQEAPQ